jgi:Holliday junction DNA helicase RuvA subunit
MAHRRAADRHNVCMIGRISGLLVDKTPPQVVVEAQGVGYEIDVPMSTFYNLPAVGERVTLLTHFVVREDAQQLFGFLSAQERTTFRELVRISGVGPRTALGILSGMSVVELTQAVAQQEAGRLVKVPGIGKKTAERLLLELKGRLARCRLPRRRCLTTRAAISSRRSWRWVTRNGRRTGRWGSCPPASRWARGSSWP